MSIGLIEDKRTLTSIFLTCYFLDPVVAIGSLHDSRRSVRTSPCLALHILTVVASVKIILLIHSLVMSILNDDHSTWLQC
jgi:hypothetical protein